MVSADLFSMHVQCNLYQFIFLVVGGSTVQIYYINRPTSHCWFFAAIWRVVSFIGCSAGDKTAYIWISSDLMKTESTLEVVVSFIRLCVLCHDF